MRLLAARWRSTSNSGSESGLSGAAGVVCHSSPIKFYESIACAGKRVVRAVPHCACAQQCAPGPGRGEVTRLRALAQEDMLASEIEKCPMALTNYTFMAVPDLLAWAKDRVIVMLCIKRAEDSQRRAAPPAPPRPAPPRPAPPRHATPIRQRLRSDGPLLRCAVSSCAGHHHGGGGGRAEPHLPGDPHGAPGHAGAHAARL